MSACDGSAHVITQYWREPTFRRARKFLPRVELWLGTPAENGNPNTRKSEPLSHRTQLPNYVGPAGLSAILVSVASHGIRVLIGGGSAVYTDQFGGLRCA